MDETKYFGLMLGHCAHLAREQMRGRMSRYDMTPVQNHVLLYLNEHGPASQSELTGVLRVTAPTANGIIDRMEEKGVLVRSVDAQDARRRLLELTDKGRGLVEQLKECFLDAERTLVGDLTEREQTQLRELLGRVMKNLEESL